MAKSNDEPVTLDCEVIDESPRAYKIEVLVGKKRKACWVGKSITTLNKKKDQIEVPTWLAEKEGLV